MVITKTKNRKGEIITTTRKGGIVTWIKRIGFWGFMFFLIKGLVWIAIFLGVGKLFS